MHDLVRLHSQFPAENSIIHRSHTLPANIRGKAEKGTADKEKMSLMKINENDVLLGRGGLTNSHIGNKRFRGIVHSHQRDYLAARKLEKVFIARKIVAIVKQSGGRFLKKNGQSIEWVEVTDKQATAKTSQALREGLDVRNNTLRQRPGKSPDSPAEADSELNANSNTFKMVMGNVTSCQMPSSTMQSPAFMTVPRLLVQIPEVYPVYFHYQAPQVVPGELKQFCEV